jgi:hypothetical protein
MAISRPFLLVLLGVALLGATVFAVQNARDNPSDGAAAPAAESQPQGQEVAAPPAAGPEDAVAGSFKNLKSASFSGTFKAGGLDQSGSVSVKGAFEEAATGKVPEFEIFIEADAAGTKLDMGMVSLGEKAYLTEGGRAYRVPQEAWDQVVKAAEQSKGNRPAVKLPVAVNPQNWLRDVKEESSQTVDGVETTHVSASLDVSAMLNESLALAQAAGTPNAQLPAQAKGQLERSIKRADFDVYVGKDDGVLRRAQADVELAPQGEQKVSLTADLNLTDVNEAQRIEAPGNVVEGVPGGVAGQLSQGLLQGLSGSGGGEIKSLAALSTDNPRKAARAVKANKKVVIFFTNPRGLDDRAVAQAVRYVDGNTKAVVLTDPVAAVESYGSLVEDLGVSQTPSVVLIDREGDARLVEGFIDSQSLAQVVADAR